MDSAIIIAAISVVVSVLIGGISTRASWVSAQAARRSAVSAERTQEVSQRQLEASISAQEAAFQPYVWADLKPRDDGSMLVFVLGNSGPTVATNVQVHFDPPLWTIVPADREEDARVVEDILARGLQSITPGRTFLWNLGVAYTYFQADIPVGNLNVTISGHGLHGPLEPLTYGVALEDLKHQANRAVGVSVLEGPLKDLSKSLKRIADGNG